MDQLSITPEHPCLPPHCKSRRRWSQFSIRSLLLLTFLVALVFALWVRPALRQRAIIAAIRSHAFVGYDFDYSGGPAPLGAPQHVPTWLVNLLGVDFFANVTYVDLREATDEDISLVAEFGHLQSFLCRGSLVTNVGAADLARTTRVTFLLLRATNVTNAGLSSLRGLRNLERLDLNGTNVTDVGMANLRDMTKLKELNLSHTKITGQGLAEIALLSGLETLELAQTNVSDAQLRHLQGLKNLKQLDLSGTKVSDAGLAKLSMLTNIESVELSGTNVTDAGLDALRLAAQVQCLNGVIRHSAST